MEKLLKTLLLIGLLAIQCQAITLEGYFRILAVIARKRDMWRKIFMGQDLGFEASPWLFEDRVKSPYVPITKSFPKYPLKGHYRNERAPPSPFEVTFPEVYSHLRLSPLPPPTPPVNGQNIVRSYEVGSSQHKMSLFPQRPQRSHVPLRPQKISYAPPQGESSNTNQIGSLYSRQQRSFPSRPHRLSQKLMGSQRTIPHGWRDSFSSRVPPEPNS